MKLDLSTLLEPLCARIDQLPRRAAARLSPAPFLPLGAEGDRPPDPLVVHALETEVRVSTRIKELLDSETQLLQQVEALQACVLHGDAAHTTQTSTTAWDDFVPEISVIVTCYNYRNFITGAMESVTRSEGVKVEIIVVDDHSSDGSTDAITEAMARWPWYPILFLARSANAGVGTARQQAIAHARADRLFILDADNLVFPNALRKLAATLSATPEAAFSYGIVAKTGGAGLLSCLPWDLTRLVVGNYIDAMAMIRRDVWDELGGYDPEASLRGLEDYELWLRLAASGRTGAFLSDFVGLYRVHSGSRQATVNLNEEPLHRRFRERYPFLPWPHGS
jgi:GT2 family glycosyltransferase